MSTLKSAREVLVEAGLAKPGNGKFSNAAKAHLATLQEGVDYAPVVKAVKREAPATPAVSTGTPAPARVKVDTSQVDPKEVRAWAAQNGHEVNARGRLPHAVVQAFLAVDGGVTVRAARPTPPADVRVRPETQAFGFYRRQPGDNPRVVSEPLLAIRTCGYCGKGISYCPCSGGPRLPLYAGGEVAILDPKPVA